MALTPRVALSHPRRISRERPRVHFSDHAGRLFLPGILDIGSVSMQEGDRGNTAGVLCSAICQDRFVSVR